MDGKKKIVGFLGMELGGKHSTARPGTAKNPVNLTINEHQKDLLRQADEILKAAGYSARTPWANRKK